MAECTCTPVAHPWTFYGVVEPGGAREPDPDCPVHFPTDEKADNRWVQIDTWEWRWISGSDEFVREVPNA